VREWLKANGGPPALVVVGIGLLLAFWPLGALFIISGVLLWLNEWSRFPWHVVRKTPSMEVGRPLPDRFVGQRVCLMDLPPMVYRRTFERCEMVGPSPALLAGCKVDGSRWLGMFERSFVEIPDVAELPPDTTSFVECSFLFCEFQDFVATGTKKQLEGLQAVFEGQT
jgi:hypothetical protein